ncbi:hypothetical protein JCM19301_1889 [Jejuia pallidilutea]|nr:hypothetical protein JCM19301_1889 [Jejuia pallidilutea]
MLIKNLPPTPCCSTTATGGRKILSNIVIKDIAIYFWFLSKLGVFQFNFLLKALKS